MPSADVARLARAAPRALVDLGADAAVFTYVSPGWTPCPILLAVHDATFMTHPEWLGRAGAGRAARAGAALGAAGGAGARAVARRRPRDVAAALRIDPAKVRVVSPHPDAGVHARADGAAERVRSRASAWSATCLAVGDLGPRKNLTALGAAVGGLGRPRPGARARRQARARGASGSRPTRAGAGWATCRTPIWPTSTAPPR